VKAKTVKAKAKKDTTIKTAKAFTVKGAQGKVSYKKANKAGKSKIKVASNGKITVKKGLKKGTYKITAKAKKTSKYKAASTSMKIVVK
jgi:hypothetical protein